MTRRQLWTNGLIGCSCFLLYLACLPIANWMIGHVGQCTPDGPCLLRLWPTSIMAPSGVVMIGLALVLRDLVQRYLGIIASIWAITLGAFLALLVAPPALVFASVASFIFSEFVDLVAYTRLLRRYGMIAAIVLSSILGLLVDSGMFLFVAFGSLDHFAGQALGKLVGVIVALPVIQMLRRLDANT